MPADLILNLPFYLGVSKTPTGWIAWKPSELRNDARTRAQALASVDVWVEVTEFK
jgi:hypothetical protein